MTNKNRKLKGDVPNILSETTEELFVPSRRRNSSNILNEDEYKVMVLMNNVRSILNKLTPINFCVLVNKFKMLLIDDDTKFQEVSDLIFEAAAKDWILCPLYVYFVASIEDEKYPERSFMSSFINKLMTLFKILPESYILLEEQEDIASCADLMKRALLIDEGKYLSRKKAVAICRILGELFKLNILGSDDLCSCMEQLLSSGPVDLNSECIRKLIMTVGPSLNNLLGEQQIEKYFVAIEELYKNNAAPLCFRIKFILLDLLEFRENGWISRNIIEDLSNIDSSFKDSSDVTVTQIKIASTVKPCDSVTLEEIELTKRILLEFINKKNPFESVHYFSKLDHQSEVKFINSLLLCVLLNNVSAEFCGILISLLASTKPSSCEAVVAGFIKTVSTYKNNPFFPELKPLSELTNVLRILAFENEDLGEKILVEFVTDPKRRKLTSPIKGKYSKGHVSKFVKGKARYMSNWKFKAEVKKKNWAHIKDSLQKITLDLIFEPFWEKIEEAKTVSDMEAVIDLVIIEVTNNPSFCPWYATLCKGWSNNIGFAKDIHTPFPLILISKCEEFLSSVKKDNYFEKWNEISFCSDLEQRFELQMKLAEEINFIRAKRYAICKFIFEILSSHVISESSKFHKILKQCTDMLIEEKRDDAVARLCKFFHLLGERAKTVATIQNLNSILNNLRYQNFPDQIKLTSESQKLVNETILFLENRSSTTFDTLPRNQMTEVSEMIFNEHLFFGDELGCADTLTKYFDREKMTAVIKDIFHSTCRCNDVARAIQFCGCLMVTLLTEDKIDRANIVDAVLFMRRTSKKHFASLPQILKLLIELEPALLDELVKASEEQFPNNENEIFFKAINKRSHPKSSRIHSRKNKF